MRKETAQTDTPPITHVSDTAKWVALHRAMETERKERIPTGEEPLCNPERIRTDVTDFPGRRKLFERVNRGSKVVTVITEVLLVYLRRVLCFLRRSNRYRLPGGLRSRRPHEVVEPFRIDGV